MFKKANNITDIDCGLMAITAITLSGFGVLGLFILLSSIEDHLSQKRMYELFKDL